MHDDDDTLLVFVEIDGDIHWRLTDLGVAVVAELIDLQWVDFRTGRWPQ